MNRYSRFGLYSILAGLLALAVAGCAPPTQPVAPCCYNGAVTLARLSELSLIGRGGRSYSVAQALPGLHADLSAFGRVLPFDKVDIQTEAFGSLRPIFNHYDANGDTILQAPELTLLLLIESARGLGKDVVGARTQAPVASLQLSSSELSALVRYTEMMRPQFNPRAQQLFANIDQLERVLEVYRNDGGPDNNRIRVF